MKDGFRQCMAWLHTWSGLLVGWVLFAVFLTGTAAYLRPEISYWMRPEIVRSTTGTQVAAVAAMAYLQAEPPRSPAWFITLPAAAVVGALMWYLGDVIGGGAGGIVVFAILCAFAAYMFYHSRKTPVDHNNVNEEWDPQDLAATRAGTVWDSLITALSMVFYCTPLFWTGLLLVLLFSVTLNWLPSFGMSTVGADYTGLRAALDVAEHLVLPALTLGLFYLAVYARLTRSSVLEVADQDFVKTARAKGVGEGRILRRHVLRNALLPVVTLAGIQAGHLIGGSILVETVFAWPGIGSLAFDALLQRDYELLLGVFLCTSVIVMLFNLLTDLLYLVIDPRVQMA